MEEPKKLPIYVLQFPSPFEKSNEKMLAAHITVGEARERFLRIYKTCDSDENKQIIPAICESQIAWMQDAITEKGKHAKIYVRDFILSAISAVLYTISFELQLTYELISSRDKDEIFCKVYASEQWLIQKAAAENYLLPFRKSEEFHLDFMQVPPYGPISLLKNIREDDTFIHYDPEGEEVENGSFFNMTDKERLVISALESRLDLKSLEKSGAMISSYCLHQDRAVRKLKFKWARLGAICTFQPLDEIRSYFAEKVAIYFAWIGIYCTFMFFAACMGLIIFSITWFVPSDDQKTIQVLTVFFAIFLCLWAAFFNQIWLRKEKILAWKWGTSKLLVKEEQRKNFSGVLQRDEVSGTMKIAENAGFQYTLRKFLGYSAVIGFIFIVFIAVGSIFIFRYLISTLDPTTSQIFGGIANALQIRLMNIPYEKLAIWLNNWENHETTQIYNHNLAVKTFLFKFVNAYSSLFYIAFLKKNVEGCETTCLDELSLQLLIIFLINFLMNIVELGLPWIKMLIRIRNEDKKVEEAMQNDSTLRMELYPVEIESKCDDYEDPLDDYMEMVIQFGYVALFGASVPYLPVLALFEILLEIRVDAWKLCVLMKRPHPDRCANIGVFRDIFLAVTYLAAFSNAGLIFFTSGAFNDSSYSEKVIGLVLLEHFLVCCIFCIRSAIPSTPQVVKKGLMWSAHMVHQQKTTEAPQSFPEEFLLKPSDLNYHL